MLLSFPRLPVSGPTVELHSIPNTPIKHMKIFLGLFVTRAVLEIFLALLDMKSITVIHYCYSFLVYYFSRSS